MGFAKKALFLFFLSVVPGCVPNPNIDLLAPREGKVGDVIDIRDPDFMSLGTEGSVSSVLSKRPA